MPSLSSDTTFIDLLNVVSKVTGSGYLEAPWKTSMVVTIQQNNLFSGWGFIIELLMHLRYSERSGTAAGFFFQLRISLSSVKVQKSADKIRNKT